MKRIFGLLISCALLSALPLAAQEFEIPGQAAPQPKRAGKTSSPKKANDTSAANSLSWGNSIDVGRLARAAQDNLQRGNYAAAADYAKRAADMAPQNKDLWFMAGYCYRLAGRLQQSLDAYHTGLQHAPGSLDGLAGSAQTLAKMGNESEARRILQNVVSSNPNRINDVLALAELDMRAGDLQSAVNLLQRAEQQQPSAHSELLMAVAYMKLKEPERAKQMLDIARKRAPRDPAIFRAVANFYREERDYQAAIDTLLSAPSKSPDVLGDLAYSYELNGDKKEAAANYVKAADGAPNVIGYQLSAAQSSLDAGDSEAGKKFLARAAQLDPDHYRLHAIRAALARKEERPDEAIREYNFAIAHLPEATSEGQLYPVLLHMNLAELYRETGNDADARRQLALAEEQISKINVEGPAKAEFLRVRASIKAGGNDLRGAEADLQQALALDPNNLNAQLQYGSLLWKMDRKADANKIYAAILARDPKNRFAIESMGYLARDTGDTKAAEQWFTRLAQTYPSDYVAYLALGDLYTATHELDKAEQMYAHAHQLAPKNAIVIANAANAAIDAHKFDLANAWLARATPDMETEPKIMLERERSLFHSGKYLESAQLGRRVVEQLPRDRNASVYLGYALYNLGRFDDVLALSNRYANILPKEPNFPLLAGHVHKQSQLLDQAVDDYSRALARDPRMVEAYVNRGYVLNDMQNAEAAAQDFDAALKLAPNNGTAELGLAFSDLQLHRGKPALDHADKAAQLMGDSPAIHLARATAYRQMRVLDKAEAEYLEALKSAPDDLRLRLALADTQYYMRHFGESLKTLRGALDVAPEDPLIYAEMAHAAAQLHSRGETLQYIEAAERNGDGSSAVLLATGDALLALGERDAAMDRFARAMDAPDADRVGVRLAIARLFTREGKWDDAKQQVSLAFAEARIGEAAPVTADDLIEAANIFLAMHEFDLAERYYVKAKDLGAGDEIVAIGKANTYIATGNALLAQSELAALGDPRAYAGNYDYELAQGEIFRQQHNDSRALMAFARANQLAGDQDTAARALEEVAADEGYRLNQRWSVSSDFTLQPLFEDQTIYSIDAARFGVTTSPGLQAPPRSSLETSFLSSFRGHFEHWPLLTGFFQVRNARGQVSLPSESLILDRNTTDYNLNGALSPVLHWGSNQIALTSGMQFTLRRDHGSAEARTEMDQNLLRQFVYLSTNSFANWVAVRGSAFHEAGPFTNRSLHSKEYGAKLEFVVGRPWGRTFLLTGYSARDLQFHPLTREYFTTSTWAGIEHRFGENLKLRAIGEYIRAWKVQDSTFAIGQAMRPAVQLEYRWAKHWTAEGNFAFSRGEGFHAYDNIQSGFLISYVKPWRRSLDDGSGAVPVEYPLRFSFGLQQQDFFNFTGRGQAQFRPVIRLTFF